MNIKAYIGWTYVMQATSFLTGWGACVVGAFAFVNGNYLMVLFDAGLVIVSGVLIAVQSRLRYRLRTLIK